MRGYIAMERARADEDHESTRDSASSRAVFLRWGFPFIALVATLASQILVPRILQIELSSAEYISYVAVTAVVAYLSLADGGLQVSFMRELSVLHAAGDRAAFAGEAGRARRVFSVIGVVGCIMAALGLTSAFEVAESAWSGATSTDFRVASMSLLTASAIHMAIGSYHSVLLFASGRLIAGQAMWVAATIVPVALQIIGLIAFRSLAIALTMSAIATLILAVLRAMHARSCLRVETAGVTPSRPTTHLRKLLLSGVSFKAAEALPISAYPHLLSVRGPALVPMAIPARTLANACRLIPQQFVNLLQVHVTRRLAGSNEEQTKGEQEFAIASSSLCAMQLAAVGMVSVLAVPIFQIWLPERASDVTAYLPGLLAEQALVSATLPASTLFIAAGRIGLLGLVRLAGVILGLITFVLVLPMAPKGAFGIGFFVSAVPVFVLGYLFERSARFQRFARLMMIRYLVSLVAATACIVFRESATTLGVVVLLCSACLWAPSVRGLWKLLSELRTSSSLIASPPQKVLPVSQ